MEDRPEILLVLFGLAGVNFSHRNFAKQPRSVAEFRRNSNPHCFG
ncbi:hypothetical protein HanXRQr2_Chr11g0515801 [Helianthus annuus]|uniref:Uncharacterized protein n=1 Tax=Helianthus annuus TaxID=4232 RepID=A0A9K3N230_HELAN|nr:hypothetical protein HanXRQr2_Chr11g0515801 [Helianthus annuus]